MSRSATVFGWGLVAASGLAGCTAAKAGVQILSAEQALHRAESYEAQRIAAYEYTMASQYLDKAREEAGYSDFRIADALARKSAEWSDRAIIFVERYGRGEMNVDELQDAPVAPAPAPAPAQPEPDDGLDLDDEDDE